MPLLNCVDDALYRHLTETAGLTLPQFALPWMASWFAQDMPDLRFASRLADVFLASHPLLPLYVSVALLTVNRSRVLRHGKSGPQRLSDLYQVLRSLPMTSLMDANAATSTDQVPHQEEDDDDNDFSESSSIMGGMSLLEDVISTALKYMYVYCCVCVSLLFHFVLIRVFAAIVGPQETNPSPCSRPNGREPRRRFCCSEGQDHRRVSRTTVL
jgi:hypothetical protein